MIISDRQLRAAKPENLERLARYLRVAPCPEWDLVPSVSIALAMTWVTR